MLNCRHSLLCGLPFDESAILGVVTDNMEAASVWAYLPAERLVGMADGDAAQRVVASDLCGVEEKFKIHHVVDDDGVSVGGVAVPRAETVPRFDGTDPFVETSG